MARFQFLAFSLFVISSSLLFSVALSKTLKRDGNNLFDQIWSDLIKSDPFLSLFHFPKIIIKLSVNVNLSVDFECSESAERNQSVARLESGVRVGWRRSLWRRRSSALVWCHLLHSRRLQSRHRIVWFFFFLVQFYSNFRMRLFLNFL